MDALSADGAYSLTLIGFVGSVFSPYYRFAGRSAPENHVSINVALTGSRGKRWTMTERRANALHRDAGTLSVGPSAMRWDGTSLTVSIDEITPLIPKRVKGTVRLYPEAVVNHPVALDADARHCWWPIAPCARVEVELEQPSLSWSGSGYFDFNTGEVPLEETFHRWNWCRANVPEGTVVLYDLLDRDDQSCSLAIKFDPKTGVTDFEPPPPARLDRSFWRMRRSTRCERGAEAKVLETLEDSPFYTRSVVASRLLGRDVTAIHESLDLDRFANPVVQWMLPYRMPRRFL
ncbi:carotenoid 1,2-hydratase [Jiella marina]|uniref:carotenoid 1,2-hydratase n=1 Tax=Jiella sp. LLJ827 TaxID=2917712 RepID=UPI002100DEA8|nr:carotenoid 1,2-hydratase [Jiella sp. LLJ827]